MEAINTGLRFRITKITKAGDRDERGRFVKAAVWLKRTHDFDSRAEFGVSAIMSNDTYTLIDRR